MESQAFFTTIAGLAVSLAGFGSVIAWLRDDPTGWDPINLWRVKTIVRHGLTIAFICLMLVPIHTFTGDQESTIRLGSALLIVQTILEMWRARRPDVAVWDSQSWKVYLGINIALALLLVANLFWASLGVLQAGVLVVLSSPAGIFSNFVREMGRRPETTPPD